jgi:hypothetical protein
LARKDGWEIILNELKKTAPDEEISIPWRRGIQEFFIKFDSVNGR